jgi:hypothetical protein
MEGPRTGDLFESPPVVTATRPGGYRALAVAELARNPEKYDAGFRAWLAKNWPIWTRFCQLADRLRFRKSHWAARALFHHLRLETELAEQPIGKSTPLFKINNNHSAQCARLYNAMSANRADFFKTRGTR